MFGLVQAIFALARALEALARALAPWQGTMADRSGPVSLTVTVQPEATGGDTMQEYAINDAQKLTISGFVPSVVSKGGNPFTKADGTPLAPEELGVAWSADNPTVAQLEFAADGRSGKVGSGAPGRAVVTAAIGPYPDGSTAQFQFGLTVGFSSPGEPAINVVVEDE